MAVTSVDLALRRLIASKRKGPMIDGIAGLTGLADELGAPVVAPGRPVVSDYRGAPSDPGNLRPRA